MTTPCSPEMVAVVIVSWNAREYLVQCLDSPAYGAFRYLKQVIVLDNGSSDLSSEVVERRFPAVRLMRNKANVGFVKANNVGIPLSIGEYIYHWLIYHWKQKTQQTIVSAVVFGWPLSSAIDSNDGHPR
jgi:GT2 family glycosyltransferase